MKQSIQSSKIRVIFISLVFGLFLIEQAASGQNFSFSIQGEVQHPGQWSLLDLEKLPVIPVKIREYSKTGNYLGLCSYWGVPLQLVLERAAIQKAPTAPFKHKGDMVIWLSGEKAKKIALSWGEIFYGSNPTHYLLAIRKSVMKPGAHPAVNPGSCKTCHSGNRIRNGKVLRRVLNDSLTGVKFLMIHNGRLIASLENLQSIRVTSVNRSLPCTMDRNHVFSNRVVIVQGGKKTDLEQVLKTQKPDTIVYTLPEIGSGCGYHGTFTLRGFPLKELFSQTCWGLLISAPDGYRTFVSRNEIMGTLGRKAILGFSKDGHLLQPPEGKYMLILPNDIFFDRWIRAVNRIEILTESQ